MPFYDSMIPTRVDETNRSLTGWCTARCWQLLWFSDTTTSPNSAQQQPACLAVTKGSWGAEGMHRGPTFHSCCCTGSATWVDNQATQSHIHLYEKRDLTLASTYLDKIYGPAVKRICGGSWFANYSKTNQSPSSARASPIFHKPPATFGGASRIALFIYYGKGSINKHCL